MAEITMINDAAHVGHDLTNSLRKRGYTVEHRIRSRSLAAKLIHPIINTRVPKGSISHVHYGLQDAYLTSKLGHLDVLHLHGSDIRKTIDGKYGWMVKASLKSAAVVLYSTPDMQQKTILHRPDAIYFATPINLAEFSIQGRRINRTIQAYYRALPYEQMPGELRMSLKYRGIRLHQFLSFDFRYAVMPMALSSCDIFIDRFTIASLSKTALEAWALGIPTIDHRHIHRLPERVEELLDPNVREAEGEYCRRYVEQNHNLEHQTETLLQIYRKIKGGELL